jgi:formamidopyrimidine-DNA glycosylase
MWSFAVPELPEVEALRRDLSTTLPGRRIVRAELTKPRMLVDPYGMGLSAVEGRTIEALRRRAKMLVLDLSGDLSMVVHLKLAGQLIHRKGDVTLASGGHPVPAFDAPMPHKSTHGRFDLDDASVLWLTDIRQFGRVTVVPTAGVDQLMEEKRLGIEPFDPRFDDAYLARRLARHSRLALKAFLLDQSDLVGLGNIYADEALSAARLSPLRPAGSLTDEEITRLRAAILGVLRYAIENGVADLPQGRVRGGAEFPRAHGRSGLPCLTCGTVVERIKVGARSTDFCPSCQPAPSSELERR